MDTLSYIIGRNSAGGGGTGSTPSWSDVTDKPFNTVGEGLEVSSGALKEAVPLYTEHTETETTDTYINTVPRESSTTYTDEFYFDDSSVVNDIVNSDSMEVIGDYYVYDLVNDTNVQVTFSQVITNVMTGGTVTDSSGKQWSIYCTNDAIRFHCLDGYEGLDLHVLIYCPDSTDPDSKEWESYPTRTEVTTYTDSFSAYLEPGTGSHIASSTEPLALEWTWYEGEGYNISSYTVSVADWDCSDNSEVYTDSNNITWHIYMTTDGFDWQLHAEAIDSLPSNTMPDGHVEITYTYTTSTDTVHQLPTQYVPIDNSTIIVDDFGKLRTNASGVQSVWYGDYQSGVGTHIGDLYVDGNATAVYAPTGLPAAPQLEGTYTLQVSVDEYGTATYSWVAST